MLRFARIVYINGDSETVHVQWLEHSSRTVMFELSDPQELFVNDLCSDICIDTIVGKVTVRKHDFSSTASPVLSHGEFYFK